MASKPTENTTVVSTEQSSDAMELLTGIANSLKAIDSRLVALEDDATMPDKVEVAEETPVTPEPVFPDVGSTFISNGWHVLVTEKTKWLDPVRQGRIVTVWPAYTVGDATFKAIAGLRMPLDMLKDMHDGIGYKGNASVAPTEQTVSPQKPSTGTKVSTSTAPSMTVADKAMSKAAPPLDNECFAITAFDYDDTGIGTRQYSCFLNSGSKVTVQRYKVVAENRANSTDSTWRQFCEPMKTSGMTVKKAVSWYETHLGKDNGSALKGWA